MPTANDLMGFGINPNLADLLGTDPQTVAGAGTTQATAALATEELINLTTTASNTGVIIPAGQPIGSITYIYNTGQTAIAYAPVGETLNGGASTTGVNIATTKMAMLVKYSRTGWASILTA